MDIGGITPAQKLQLAAQILRQNPAKEGGELPAQAGGPKAPSAPNTVIIAVSVVIAQLLQGRVHDRWSVFQAI